MSRDGRKPSDTPPWRVGVIGVTGVEPPGRRLAPPDERRPTPWSASGVRGVTPPGGATPTSRRGATSDTRSRRIAQDNCRILQRRRRLSEDAIRPTTDRPQAGFLPDVFADIQDPPDLQDFLKLLSDFLDEHPPREEAIDDVDHLVIQSRAPFELVVGFTVMSALVGRDDELRQDFASALERGANAFFNLARRLNPRLRVPRGIIPEVVDALFFDLPELAYQVPFAFATDAFVRIMPLLRRDDEPTYDEQLLRFAVTLRQRFVENRTFGDQPLGRMFPWTPPDWAPETFSYE